MIIYAPDGSPSNIWYNYTRHGRQLSGWWRPEGRPDLDNSVFEEFLRQGQQSRQTLPTPARPRQPPQRVNPPRHSGWQRQPAIRPDNVYGDEAPIDCIMEL